jgi:hypothetical protein
MRWIRANKRSGGGLALLALAIQFVLALGHVHIHPTAPAAASVVASHSDRISAERGGFPVPRTEANCDICAVLHMASAGQIATAPALVLPHLIVGTEGATVADGVVVSTRHFLAQSRAPPVV